MDGFLRIRPFFETVFLFDFGYCERRKMFRLLKFLEQRAMVEEARRRGVTEEEQGS